MLITILEFGQLEYMYLHACVIMYVLSTCTLESLELMVGAQFVYLIRFSSQVNEDPRLLDRYLVISFKQIEGGSQ